MRKSLYVKLKRHITQKKLNRLAGSHQSSHMYRHTQTHAYSTAAADVQQWESATYFFVVFLARRLRILTVVVSRRPAAGIRLSVVQFILLIGHWPRRAQRVGLRLLNTTLDLHLPLQCLENEDGVWRCLGWKGEWIRQAVIHIFVLIIFPQSHIHNDRPSQYMRT